MAGSMYILPRWLNG